MSYLELILQLNFQVTLDFTMLIFKYPSGLWGAVLEQHLLGSSSIILLGNHLAEYKRYIFKMSISTDPVIVYILKETIKSNKNNNKIWKTALIHTLNRCTPIKIVIMEERKNKYKKKLHPTGQANPGKTSDSFIMKTSSEGVDSEKLAVRWGKKLLLWKTCNHIRKCLW